MRALVLGAQGQVGRALLAQAPDGCLVEAADRTVIDLGGGPEAIERALDKARPDVVINAAAYTAVDAAETDAEAARRVNGDGVGHLARATSARGVRLLHISTDFVFDGAAGRPYTPDDAPRPLNVYGETKLDGERQAIAAAPDTLVVRTSWVYAVDGKNFLRTMLRLMAERDTVRVVSDQIGTPTSATSLARALWALAPTALRGVHHFTDAGVASWYDFAQAIAEEGHARGLLARLPTVTPILTTDFPTPARRPSYSVLDKTSAWTALGHPAAHWRHELRSAIHEMEMA